MELAKSTTVRLGLTWCTLGVGVGSDPSIPFSSTSHCAPILCGVGQRRGRPTTISPQSDREVVPYKVDGRSRDAGAAWEFDAKSTSRAKSALSLPPGGALSAAQRLRPQAGGGGPRKVSNPESAALPMAPLVIHRATCGHQLTVIPSEARIQSDKQALGVPGGNAEDANSRRAPSS